MPQRPSKRPIQNLKILLISSEPWVLLSWKKQLLFIGPRILLVSETFTKRITHRVRPEIKKTTEDEDRDTKNSKYWNDCLNYSEKRKTGPKKREEIVIWISKPKRDTVRVNYIQLWVTRNPFFHQGYTQYTLYQIMKENGSKKCLDALKRKKTNG